MSLDKTMVNKVLSEFVGTFTLTAVVVVMAQTIGQPFLTGLAAALVVATFYTTIGAVSGAHLNPAVTLGFFSLRKIKASETLGYLIFQFLGAFAATRLIQYMYGAKLPGGNKTGKFEAKLFVAELIGAIVFTWGISAVVNRRVEGYQASAAIGTSLFLGIMLAAMTTGGGYVNPAVAFGNKALNLNTALAPVIAAVFAMNLVNILEPTVTPATATVASKASTSSSRKTTTRRKRK